MQPKEHNTKHPFGSHKARQQRIRDITNGLQPDTDVLPQPSLDNLHEEQLEALQLALDGFGMYITGAAGMSRLPRSIAFSFSSQEQARHTYFGAFTKHLYSEMVIVLP